MLRKKSARLPISRNIELKSNEIYFDKDNKKGNKILILNK